MELSEEQAKGIALNLHAKLHSVESLTLGAHNVNALLKTDRGNFVVRIAPPTRSESLEHEYEFLKLLDGKYGPRVLFFDDSKEIIDRDYLVEEYIEGDHPETADDTMISWMAEFYKHLHNEILCKPNHAFADGKYSMLHAYKDWVLTRYIKHKSLLPETWESRLSPLIDQVTNIVEREDHLFADRNCFSIVQLDPSPRNVFVTDDGIKLVDWEFVKYDAPEWDLVSFIWAWELTKDQTEYFLKQVGYEGSQETLDICMLVHICMMLSWRVERLCKIRRGEIVKGLTHSDEEKLVSDLEWIVPQIEDLVQQLR